MRGCSIFVVFVGWSVLLGCSKGPLEGLPEVEGLLEGGAAGSPTSTGGDPSTTSSTGEGGSGGDIFPTGGTGGRPDCAGQCYLWKSALFEDLAMFWMGSGEAPACPDYAPAVGVTLYADPQPSPFICPVCSCMPAGCTMAEEMDVSAGKCVDGQGASVSWDSPGWDGACTADGAIAPDLMCSGMPCTQSISFAPPGLEPCAPVAIGKEKKTDPVWGLTAQECILGPLSGEGCDGSEACVQAPPDGFSLCLYRLGDDVTPDQCPEAYPRHLVMYTNWKDTRGCKPCSCSDPQGGECSALVSVFSDGACGALAGAAIASTDESACVDLPAGAGLGSKSAEWLVQSPGSCAPNSGPVGDFTPTVPMTLCCQEEPPPPAQ